MTPANLQRWRFIHTWSSLVCSLFLLLLCVTGLVMVWIDEIDAVFAGHAPPPPRPALTGLAHLDEIFRQAQMRVPGERVTHADWAFDGVLLGVNMAKEGAEQRSRQLVFDAHSGQYLEDSSTDNADHPVRVFLRIANRLHITLFAGLPGELFLASMTMMFVAAIISGVALYGPYRRQFRFGQVRTDRHRSRWLDIHNLLGIVTLGWLLVVSITGIMNAFTVPLYAAWQQSTIPKLVAEYAGQAPASSLIGPQAALDMAHAAVPGSRMVRIVPPGGWRGSPRHYVVWTQGATPISQKIFRPVLVDAETGEVSLRHAPPWYLQALQMSRPLHFGDYGGIPLKVLWTLFDGVAIVILLSGLYLWLDRRKKFAQIGAM